MAVKNQPSSSDRSAPRGMPQFTGESGKLLGMGLELGLLIGGLAYLGYWLDERYGTGPWLAFTGVMLAMVGGTYNLAKLLLKPTQKFTKTPAKTPAQTPTQTPTTKTKPPQPPAAPPT